MFSENVNFRRGPEITKIKIGLVKSICFQKGFRFPVDYRPRECEFQTWTWNKKSKHAWWKVYVFKRVSGFPLITGFGNVNFRRGLEIKNSKSAWCKVYVFNRDPDFLLITSFDNVNFIRGLEIKNWKYAWWNVYVFKRVSVFLLITRLKHVNFRHAPAIKKLKIGLVKSIWFQKSFRFAVDYRPRECELQTWTGN